MIYWLEFLLISMMFMFSSPMILIYLLVGFISLVCLALVWVTFGYFYSYLIFLLFVSGVVIMFMYLCSIMLIEKIEFKCTKIYMSLLSVLFVVYYLFYYMNFLIVDGLFIFKIYQYYEFYNIHKLMNYSFGVFTLFFIIYLFICLLIIYEIIKFCDGPLRVKI